MRDVLSLMSLMAGEQNLSGWTRELDSMRISRVLRSKLPASVVLRLISSPPEGTMKHLNEICKIVQHHSRTVGRLIVPNLAIKINYAYKTFI